MEEKDAARLVSAEVAGLNFRTVIVAEKAYVINPPTIARLCGAVYWLSDMGDFRSMREILENIGRSDHLARALSYLIRGDDSLWEELSHGTREEVTDSIEAALDLIDLANFTKLSALTRSVKTLTAKQR